MKKFISLFCAVFAFVLISCAADYDDNSISLVLPEILFDTNNRNFFTVNADLKENDILIKNYQKSVLENGLNTVFEITDIPSVSSVDINIQILYEGNELYFGRLNNFKIKKGKNIALIEIQHNTSSFLPQEIINFMPAVNVTGKINTTGKFMAVFEQTKDYTMKRITSYTWIINGDPHVYTIPNLLKKFDFTVETTSYELNITGENTIVCLIEFEDGKKVSKTTNFIFKFDGNGTEKSNVNGVEEIFGI